MSYTINAMYDILILIKFFNFLNFISKLSPLEIYENKNDF